MIRPLLTVLLLSCVGTSQAFASCIDFTGSWKGECQEASGKKVKASININQKGCHLLVLDNRFFPVGQIVETEVPSAPGESNLTWEVVNFQNRGTELNYRYSGIATKPGRAPLRIDTTTSFKRASHVLQSETFQTQNNYRNSCTYFLQR